MEGSYYKTKESVDEYIKLAKGVNGKALIDKFNQVLFADATILEIGSGPGSDWEILNESYNVVGSDNSGEFLAHLKKQNPNGQFFDINAETLETDIKFDAIYSNKVLHHLSDDALTQSVKRQSEILNDNGIICHSFWKGEGSEIFKGLFVNYHSKETIKKAFEKHFEILTLEEYNEFDPEDSLLLIGRKNNL